jgi:tetratricopeptide (TPR) repeat protein
MSAIRSLHPVSVALAFLASGCATSSMTDTPAVPAFESAPQPAPSDAPAEDAVPVETAVESVAAASAPAPLAAAEASFSPAEQEPAQEPEQDPSARAEVLSIWNSPAFRRQLALSYLSETEIEPGVTLEERDLVLEVMDLVSKDQIDEAVELILDVRTEGSSAVFDFTLANLRFQQDDLPAAVVACRQAIDKHPKFRRAWRLIGQIHVREAEFDEALPALTRVVELGGGDAITYGMLGFAYVSTARYLPAESAFRQAILLDPYTIDWKMGLAESLFRQARFPEAVAFFGQLIEENPSKPDFWLAQGEGYARMGETLKAAENFEMVDRLGGSTYDSLMNLGDIYANAELFELAVSGYQRALAMDPTKPIDRLVRAAKYLSANGALSETRALVETIEASLGEDVDVAVRKDLLRLRARIAVAEGVGEEEATILEQIVALDPLDGDALILLGQHAGRGGDVEQAIFYFERAANIDGFEADAKIRHGQLLVGQGRYQEALPLLRRAQQLAPRDNVQEYIEQVERFAQSR